MYSLKQTGADSETVCSSSMTVAAVSLHIPGRQVSHGKMDMTKKMLNKLVR